MLTILVGTVRQCVDSYGQSYTATSWRPHSHNYATEEEALGRILQLAKKAPSLTYRIETGEK